MKQEKLDLLISNAQAVKKGFKLQNAMVRRLTALLYTLENRRVDCDAIRECRSLIRRNAGIFSRFRGNLFMCIAGLLSLKDKRQELIEHTLSVYDLMKRAKFRASDYLVAAAYQIAAHTDHDRAQYAVSRASEFYDGMKAQRWFYTGQDDYIYAAMLGLSDMDPAYGVEQIERIYQLLKGEFWSGNSVLALAQILALGGRSEQSAGRVLELRDALKNRKIRLDKAPTLPALGILALLPVNIEVIVQDICDARAFLRKQKGFGVLSVSVRELLLYSSAITASSHADDLKNSVTAASLSASIAGIILAQQTAIITSAVVSSTMAASASSSN